ncbi:hypothetical protein LOZ53_003910 [Ophidiomyces ophidiicola]|nr:hypothetical protein LOZ55_004678 [Ophidiomyces ophidiicola]KAI1986079.1 hypothetical protein LOZ54_003983 [Ophidiomyces ophidiicola]KAI1988457.1 hypothetical protein LOZ53_003910 [Ophidiomyces ophidiicola]KAI1988870.1 hypothetical protein LOZ51_005257 [Ophidiomyces ophidiicola]
MSDRYFGDGRRRQVTGFGSSGRRTALGYWVPLAITVSVAAVGLAAWVWSERNEGDGDEYGEGQHSQTPIKLYPESESSRHADLSDSHEHPRLPDGDNSMISRMQDAWRQAPSPQQWLDGASKKVVAGVAAAGAAVGGALSAIREEEHSDPDDSPRNANQQGHPATTTGPGTSTIPYGTSGPPFSKPTTRRIRTIAIVISSISKNEADEDISAHTSILAHLPAYIEPDTARIFVLIYAPGVQPRASEGTSTRPSLSVASSYSNISPGEATNTGSAESAFLKDVEPKPASDDFPSAPRFFKALYSQAQALVDKETMIIPFATPAGHLHILRHLSPDFVYIQESLTGTGGETVHNLTGWVRQVVVVVGDEHRGVLVDSEDESASAEQRERWWQKEGVLGLGKQIDVVDGVRVGDDWKRRVCGHE